MNGELEALCGQSEILLTVVTHRESFAKNHYNKENYNQFMSLFNPPYAPTYYYAYVGYWVQSLTAIYRYGLFNLKAALVAGQYHEAKGQFYGGTEIQPSLSKLYDWLESYIDGKSFAAVTWVDVHTGLGKSGEDTMLPAINVDGSEEVYRDEVEKWYPDSHNPFPKQSGSTTGSDVAKGYKGVKFTGDYFLALFDRSQQPLLAAEEFGTIPMVLVGRALTIENAAHNHLPADQALVWAKRTLRPAFYPSRSDWRRQILERGTRVLQQSILRSLVLSPEIEETDQSDKGASDQSADQTEMAAETGVGTPGEAHE